MAEDRTERFTTTAKADEFLRVFPDGDLPDPLNARMTRTRTGKDVIFTFARPLDVRQQNVFRQIMLEHEKDSTFWARQTGR